MDNRLLLYFIDAVFQEIREIFNFLFFAYFAVLAHQFDLGALYFSLDYASFDGDVLESEDVVLESGHEEFLEFFALEFVAELFYYVVYYFLV